MHRRLVGRTAELRRLSRALGRGSIRGAILAGPAGVGKTRLAREWLADSCRRRETVAVSATAAAASIPFGAFAHLLPAELPADAPPLTVLQSAVRALVERNGTARGLVVAVDDAHLLDDASATLVHRLVDANDAFVVLTLRLGESVPDPILAVGKDERVEWVEVGPLSEVATRRLAEQLLEGPVDSATMQQLWERTGGNPLYVTELVCGGLEAGVLSRSGELWSANGLLKLSGRLREVLAARIRSLPEAERAALAIVAAAERLELELLEQQTDPRELEALEQRGLTVVEEDRRRSVMAVAHPLYAEVARSDVPRLTARHLAGDLARQLSDTGMRRRDDLLRWAAWQLQSGRPAPAADLLAAARKAKATLDPELAERCAEVAAANGGGFDAELLHADAIAAQGRTEEVPALFADLAAQARDDAQRAQVALAHATSLLFQAGDRRCLEVLDAAIDTVTETRWRDELEAMLVFAAAYLGDLPLAVEEGGPLIARLDEGTSAVVRTAVIHTYALVLMGRYDSAAGLIDEGLRAAERARETFPIGEHLLLVNRVFGLEASGRINQAEQFVHQGYQHAVASDTLDVRGLWATNLGLALCFRGDLAGFVHHLDEGLAALRQRDPVGMLLLALSLGALAHAMIGQRGHARRLLDEYDTQSGDRIPAFGENWRHRVDAWVHPAGFGEDAARLALHAGQMAAREHHFAYGALNLHDAVRFGHPELVLSPLEDLVPVTEGELIPSLAHHARMLRERDPSGLEDVSQRFEAMGADLFAAESAAQASHLHTRTGATDRARTTRKRALVLAGSGARCPTLWLWISRPGSLTDRELEIARLAADGWSDRDIAEQLTISPRTVGNHLTSVYDKLDISGRDELDSLVT